MSYDAGNGGISGDAGAAHAPRLFDEVRRHMRLKHYSLRTEKAYLAWMRRFILAKDVATTQIYTHVLNRDGHGVLSPLDR